jgi:outer membrane protein assembly factor BamB
VNRPAAAHSFLFAAFILLCSVSVAGADNWPNWRGPTYDGISTETGLVAEWSADKNLAWKLPLPGMGGSTPAVWGDKIFVTCEDDTNLLLVCISTDGKELWKRKLGTSGKKKYRGDEGNEASASPSTDGKHVYAFVASGDLACYDFAGNEVWHVDVQKRYGKFNIAFGLHSTPVLYEDRLYLQLIHTGCGLVVALNKADGKEKWKVTRKSDGTDENEHSYASPSLWHNGKDAYLIVHGNDYATAHKLSDGSEIWRVAELNPRGSYNKTLRFVSSPVATPDLIVVPSAKNGPVVGIRPDATGLVVPGNSAEQWRRPTHTPDVPSPRVLAGLVYLCGERGNLICMDAKTGKEHYNERIFGDRYRASPVYADGKIYLTARGGVVTVVKAGEKFEKLATNRLDDVITGCPAVSNGRIYLHGFNALYAIGEAKK